jgi:hypothetical protein
VRRPEGYRRPPTSYDGLFRVTLKRVVAARDLDTDKGACTLTFEVAWVPNLLPLFLETQPQGLRMLDDRGKPVAVPAGGSSLGEAEGKTSLTFDVTLPALPRSAQRIGLVEGKLSAVAPSKMLTFRFDNLARLAKAAPGSAARRQTQEATRCRIEKITVARDRWSVRVAVEMPEGSKPLESFQATSWLANNAMWLASADGKRRLPSGSYVVESCSARRAVLTYNFLDSAKRKRGRPEDWNVVYRTPALIVDIPIAFRFQDIPLP